MGSMIKTLAVAVSFPLLAGCAQLPVNTQATPIEKHFPVGYPRLVDLIPECEALNPSNYASCLVAAQMMESATTQLSTYRLLTYWGEMISSPATHPSSIEAAQRIFPPVLKRLYGSSHDPYSRYMLQQVDKIQLASADVLITMQKIHHCLTTGEKVSRCPTL